MQVYENLSLKIQKFCVFKGKKASHNFQSFVINMVLKVSYLSLYRKLLLINVLLGALKFYQLPHLKSDLTHKYVQSRNNQPTKAICVQRLFVYKGHLCTKDSIEFSCYGQFSSATAVQTKSKSKELFILNLSMVCYAHQNTMECRILNLILNEN